MLEVDVLLTEQQLASEFRAALERRFLPEKFFYWFPLSVAAWLELCRDVQPYKNYSRSHQLVAAHAAALARGIPPGSVEVVSLGAGQGDKDLLLLETLRAAGSAARYSPVDSSQALLELALERAAAAGFPARGLKADLDDPATFARLSATAETPRLCLVLGNTIGALDPPKCLARLGALVRPQDRLVADAEIFRGEETLAGYDNPINRRFAFAPLASLGLAEGRDGRLVFEAAADLHRPGLYFVGKYFQAARPLPLEIAGHTLELAAEEKIRMSRSAKYAPETFLRLLDEAGFAVEQESWSEDRGFLLVLAAPAR
jgi:L-histidine Nalpha-methyltransferase